MKAFSHAAPAIHLILPLLVGTLLCFLWLWWNPHAPVWGEVAYHELALRLVFREGTMVPPSGPPAILYAAALPTLLVAMGRRGAGVVQERGT